MEDKLIYSKRYQEYLDSLPKELLLKILENLYTEVYVTDGQGEVVYVNPMSIILYGAKPEDLVGKSGYEVGEGRWSFSVLEKVMREKKLTFTEQEYYALGKKVIVAANPVLDEKGDVELLVTTSNREFNDYELTEDVIKEYLVDNNIEDTEYYALKEEIAPTSIGNSKVFTEVLALADKCAKSESNILILGNSGTGKSHLAKRIHSTSRRKDNQLIFVNCAAIPENLIESELFGYEANAFTGASSKGKKGLFVAADKGTIFLDEIGELPLSVQAKLLDVTENKRFYPVGSNKLVYADVRIIAATNIDIENEVKNKSFRKDLFWRINTITITMPELKDRQEDILPLSMYYLNKLNRENKCEKMISLEVIPYLIAYDWPGNIRQLRNAIEWMIIMSDGNEIKLKDLPSYITVEFIGVDKERFEEGNDIFEYIKYTLVNEYYARFGSSRAVAEALGISQSTANRMIQKYVRDNFFDRAIRGIKNDHI